MAGELKPTAAVDEARWLQDTYTLSDEQELESLLVYLLGPVNQPRNLLRTLVPLLARLGGDVDLLLAVLNPTLERMRDDTNRFADQLDPDRCDARMLPYLLRLVGWNYPMVLTERQQRGLAKSAVHIYQQKGTKIGLANALRTVLGLEAEINVAGLNDAWTLGVSELSVDTVLGADPAGASADTFTVQFARALSDQERDAAVGIIEFMKPVHANYVIREAAS